MKKVLLILGVLLFAVLSPAFSATEPELFSEAESYYRAGNYLLALDTYAEFIQTFPLSDRVADAQYRRKGQHHGKRQSSDPAAGRSSSSSGWANASGNATFRER